MLKIFQKFNYNSLIIILFSLIILWLSSFVKYTPFEISSNQINAPLYKIFENLFSFQSKNFVFISFILIVLQTIYLTYFTNKYKLFGEDSLIIALIYILLSGYFFIQKISPVLIANTFLLIALDIFIQTNQEKKSLIKFLNASTILAISSLFYYPYIFFLFFALVAVIIIRSRITKEFFLIIFGFIITYLFFFEIYYLIFDKIPSLKIFWESIGIKNIKFENNLPNKIYFSFLFVLFLLANSKISKTLRTKRIELRTIYQLFFFLFIFTIILFFAIPSINLSFLLTIFIPLSFLFSNYFMSIRATRINKIIFLLFFLLPFIFQIIILF